MSDTPFVVAFLLRVSAALVCLLPFAQVIGCAADTNVVEEELCSPAAVAEYATARTTADSMAAVSTTVGSRLTEACKSIAESGGGAPYQLVTQDPIETLVDVCSKAREVIEQLFFSGLNATVTPPHCSISNDTEACLVDCEPGVVERCRILCAARARFQYTCDSSVVALDVSETSQSKFLAELRIIADSYYEADFVMEAVSDLNDVRLELDSESMGCRKSADWFSHVDEDTSLLHSTLVSSAQLLDTLAP